MIEDWILERELFGYEEEEPAEFFCLISKICRQILGYLYCSLCLSDSCCASMVLKFDTNIMII